MRFLLLLLLLESLLPLLLPRLLLWLLLQLPAAKHHGPKGRTESKIYVSRGRNVPSEISYKKLAAATATAAALAAAAPPGSKTQWP